MYRGEYAPAGSKMNFFTRKLEAQLRFEQIPWRYLFKTLSAVLDDLQGSYYQCAQANVAAGLAGANYYAYDCGFGTIRARTQKRLNLARLHAQDEMLRTGAADYSGIKALFAGRGILEHYLT